MCFSERWSLNLSILGSLLTIYRIYYKYPMVAIVPTFFYTIMEVTQYLQYQVINQCDNEINKNLTKFTWILEWIQPLMWNIVYLYITKSNKDVFRFSIFLSLLIFIAGIARVFNNSTNKSITHELQVKGRNCTIQGDKHLMWNNNAQTFYGLEPNWFVYLLLFFIPTLWITPFKIGFYTFFSQFFVVIATLLIIGRIDDQAPSVWCLLSIPGFFIGELINRLSIK